MKWLYSFIASTPVKDEMVVFDKGEPEPEQTTTVDILTLNADDDGALLYSS